MAAIPPTNAYTAQTKANSNAKEPNTSTESPLPPAKGECYIVLVRASPPAGAGVPPGAASYFDAHFACTCSATKQPSAAGRPSTSACDLSTKVSGRGSVPT